LAKAGVAALANAIEEGHAALPNVAGVAVYSSAVYVCFILVLGVVAAVRGHAQQFAAARFVLAKRAAYLAEAIGITGAGLTILATTARATAINVGFASKLVPHAVFAMRHYRERLLGIAATNNHQHHQKPPLGHGLLLIRILRN
jgi:hypothetical protein